MGLAASIFRLIDSPQVTSLSERQVVGLALLVDAPASAPPGSLTASPPRPKSFAEPAPVLRFHEGPPDEIEFAINHAVRYIVFENAGDAKCIASGPPDMAPRIPPWPDQTLALPTVSPAAKSQSDADTFHPENFSVVSLEGLPEQFSHARDVTCTVSRSLPYRDSFDAHSLVFQHITLTNQAIGEYRLEATAPLSDLNLDVGRITSDPGNFALDGGVPPTNLDLQPAAGRDLLSDATLKVSWTETRETNLRDALTFVDGALVALIFGLFIEMYKFWLAGPKL
jgi:hypothetical protein